MRKAAFLGGLTAISIVALLVSACGSETSDDTGPAAGPAGEAPALDDSGGGGGTVDQSLTGSDYSITGDSTSAGVGTSADAGSGSGGGVGGSAATGGGGGAGSATANQIIDRKIQRNSTLSITVDNVFDAVNQIQAAATGVGGYVSQQNVTETEGPEDENGKPTKRQLATVQIRVPSESYDNVMSGLRGIAAEVTAENSQTVEVTAQYTDLQSQLRNLEATEKQYLALLERAGTIEEILTVSDRLASVRLQIEQVQGQINLLENLTSLATITINVSLPPIEIEAAVVEPVKEPNFAREALEDSWQASEEVLKFLAVAGITAGVVMVWVLVPGAVILAGWRLFGGRRGTGPASS